MKISDIRIGAVLLFVLVLCGGSQAAEQRVSLHDALLISLKQNHQIRANELRLRAAGEDVNIAGSFLLPKITFEERFMRTDNPTYAFMAKLNQGRFSAADFAIGRLNRPDPVTDFQTSVSFEQALFAPRAYIGREMAKKGYEAKSEDISRSIEQTVFTVFKTCLDIQTARAYTAAADRAIEDATEHLRIAESRYRTGLGLYSDMLRAQVALRSAEERKVSAYKNLLVAKRALGLMLGMTESLDLDDQKPALALKSLEYYSDKALTRKDLKGMEAMHQNAGNSLRMANSAYLPTIGIGGSYQMNSHRSAFGSEGDSYQVMAFLRWELFDGLRRESERQKAKFLLAEAGEHLNGMKKQISFAVYEAYLSVEEARQALELAKANLISAEEGRRLVKTRYENSLSAAVDLLDVQASLDAARADTVAREAALQAAIARLGYESGTIMEDLEIEK